KSRAGALAHSFGFTRMCVLSRSEEPHLMQRIPVGDVLLPATIIVHRYVNCQLGEVPPVRMALTRSQSEPDSPSFQPVLRLLSHPRSPQAPGSCPAVGNGRQVV